MAMREARRQVSGNIPNIPPIPERHRNRPSLTLDQPTTEVQSDGDVDDSMGRKSSFKKKSLTLNIEDGLGLGLEKDFERVIEAQKVIIYQFLPSLCSLPNESRRNFFEQK